MQSKDSAPRPLTCHRCGRSMDLHCEEAVEDRRIAIFRCSACDTLEAVDLSKAAEGNQAA